MKITLISNYVPDQQQSMLRYSEMLRKALFARGHEVTVLHPPALVGRLPFLRGELAKWIGYIDKFLIAPWYFRGRTRRSDIVHVCDHSNAMYLRCAGNKPSVITCHDLIAVLRARDHYPGVHTRATGRVLQGWTARSLRQATNVICVSGQTMADFRVVVPECRAKLRVIPNALNRQCAPAQPNEIERETYRLGLAPDAPYLLHVGGNLWYKNRLGTMRIFAELKKHSAFSETYLVMVGHPWTAEMREFAASCGAADWMIEAVRLGDQALNALYGGAQALLFPSLTEGFGWPILEAQACGCPVITSNRAPMTEVAGEAAIYVDPVNPATAARAIVEQWDRLEALRTAGFCNVANFSEEKMMTGYLDVYQEILAEWPQCSSDSGITPSR